MAKKTLWQRLNEDVRLGDIVTMNRDTRRLVQLTVSGRDKTDQLMDMLLSKKRSKDRRTWLETKGNLAEI